MPLGFQMFPSISPTPTHLAPKRCRYRIECRPTLPKPCKKREVSHRNPVALHRQAVPIHRTATRPKSTERPRSREVCLPTNPSQDKQDAWSEPLSLNYYHNLGKQGNNFCPKKKTAADDCKRAVWVKKTRLLTITPDLSEIQISLCVSTLEM